MQPSGGYGDLFKACFQTLKSPEFAHVACRETTNAGGERILEVTRAKQLGLLGENLQPVTVTLTEVGLCTLAVLFRPAQRFRLQDGSPADLHRLIDLLRRVADPGRHVFCPGILPDQAKLCEKDKRLVVHQHPFRRFQAVDCPVWYPVDVQPGAPAPGPLQMCPACQCLVASHVQSPGGPFGPPPADVPRPPAPRAVTTTVGPSKTYPAIAAQILSTSGRQSAAAPGPKVVRTCSGDVAVEIATNCVGHVHSSASAAAGHALPPAQSRQLPPAAVVTCSSAAVPARGHRQSSPQGSAVSGGPTLQTAAAAGCTPSQVTATTTTAAATSQHGSSGFPQGAGAVSSCSVPAVLTRNDIAGTGVPEGTRTALARVIRNGFPVQVRGSSSAQVLPAGPNVPGHVMQNLRAQNCGKVVPLTQASNTNPSVLQASRSRELSSRPTDGPLDLSQVRIRNAAPRAVSSSLQGLPLGLTSGSAAVQILGGTPESQRMNPVPVSTVPTACGTSTTLAKSVPAQNIPEKSSLQRPANSSGGRGGPQIVVSSVPNSQALLTLCRGPAVVPAQQPVVIPTSTHVQPSRRDLSYSVAGPNTVGSVTWTRTVTSDTLSSAQAPAHQSAPTPQARQPPPGATISPESLASQTARKVPPSQPGKGQKRNNLKMVPAPNMADHISTLVAQKASVTSPGASGSATAAVAADSVSIQGRPSNSSSRPAQAWQGGRAPGAAAGDSCGLSGSGTSERPGNASSRSAAAQKGCTVETPPSANQHPPTSAVPPSPAVTQIPVTSHAQLPAQPLRLPTVPTGYLPPSGQGSAHTSAAQGATAAAAAGGEPAERDRDRCSNLPVKKQPRGRLLLPEASDPSGTAVSNGLRFSTPNAPTHVRPDFIQMPCSGAGSTRAPLVSTTRYQSPPPLATSQSMDALYEQFQIKKPPNQPQARDVPAPAQGAQGQLGAVPRGVWKATAVTSSPVTLRLVQSHIPLPVSTAASSNSVPNTGSVLGSSPAVSSAGPHQAVLSTAAAAVATAAPAVMVTTVNAMTVPCPPYPPGAVVFKIPNPVDSTKPAKKPRSRSSSATPRSRKRKETEMIFVPISLQSNLVAPTSTAALPAGLPLVPLLGNNRPVQGKDVPLLLHTTLAAPAVAPNAPAVTSAVGQSAVMQTQSGKVNTQSASLGTLVRIPNVAAPATNAGSFTLMPVSVQGPLNATLAKDPKAVMNSQQEPLSQEGTARKKGVKRLQKAATSSPKKTPASTSRRKGKTKEQATVAGPADPSQVNATGNAAAENAPQQSHQKARRSSGSRPRQRKPKAKAAVGEGACPAAPLQDSAAPAPPPPPAAPAPAAATAPTAAAAPAADAPAATAAPADAPAPSLPHLPADADLPKKRDPARRKPRKKTWYAVKRRSKARRGEPRATGATRGPSRRRRKKTAAMTLQDGTTVNGQDPSGLAGSDPQPAAVEDCVATRVRSKARTTRNALWLGGASGHSSGQNGDSTLWYESASPEKSDAWVPVNASPEGVTIHLPDYTSFRMLVDAATVARDELIAEVLQGSHSSNASTTNDSAKASPQAEPRPAKDVYEFQDDSSEAPKSTEENRLTLSVSKESASTSRLGGTKRHNKSLVHDVTNDSPIMTSATCVSNPEKSASESQATAKTDSRRTGHKSQELDSQKQDPVSEKSDKGLAELSSDQNGAAAAVPNSGKTEENGPRCCEGKKDETNVDRYIPNAASSASESAVAVQSCPPQGTEGGGPELEPVASPQSGSRASADRLPSEEGESRLIINEESPTAQEAEMENKEQANLQYPRKTQVPTWCCSLCGAEYKNGDLLQHHMKIHTAWKPFFCSVCKKNFPSSDVLRAHVESHGDSRLKLCSICYKVLKGKDELCRHQKKHRQPRRVSCPVCFMSFQKSSTLQMHMGCHNKAFNWGKQKKKVDTGGYEPLITQKESTDVDNVAKIFSCPHCRKSFKTLRWCRLHMPKCLLKQQTRECRKIIRLERARLVQEAKRKRNSRSRKKVKDTQDPQINKNELAASTPAADQLPPTEEEEEDTVVQDSHEIGGIITPELSSLQEEDVEDDADAQAEDGSDLENPGTPSTIAYLITPPCSPSEVFEGRWDDVPFAQETEPVEIKVEPADTVDWEHGATFAIRTAAPPAEPESEEGLAFAAPLDLPVLTPPNTRRSLAFQASRHPSSVKPPVPKEGDSAGVAAEELSSLEEASTTDPPIPSDTNDHDDLTPPDPEENEIQPVIMEVKSVPESEFHSGIYPDATTPLSPPSAETSATSQDDSFCQEHAQTTPSGAAVTVSSAEADNEAEECNIAPIPSGSTLALVQDAPPLENITQLPEMTLETAPQDVLDPSQQPAASVPQTHTNVGTIADDDGVCDRASDPDVMSPGLESKSEERPLQMSGGSDSPPPLLLPHDAPFGSDVTPGALPPVLTRIDQSSPKKTASEEGNDSCRGRAASVANREGPFRALTVTKQDTPPSTPPGRDLSGSVAAPSNPTSRRATSGMTLPVVIHKVYDPSLERLSASGSLPCIRDTVFSKRQEPQVQSDEDVAASLENAKETESSQNQQKSARSEAASVGSAEETESSQNQQKSTRSEAASMGSAEERESSQNQEKSVRSEAASEGNAEETESSQNHQRSARSAAASKETETRRKFALLCAFARSRRTRQRILSLSNTSEDDGTMDMIEVDVAEDLQDKDTESETAAASTLDAGDCTNKTRLTDPPPNATVDKTTSHEDKRESPSKEKKSEKNRKACGRNGTKTSIAAGEIRSLKKAMKVKRDSRASKNTLETEAETLFWRDTSPLPLLVSPKRYIRKTQGKKHQVSEGGEILPAKVNICERVKQRKRPERNLCEKTMFRQLSAWAVHSSRSSRKAGAFSMDGSSRNKRKSPLGSAHYHRKRIGEKSKNRKNALEQWRSRQSSPVKARRSFPRRKATLSRRKSTEADVRGVHSTQDSSEDNASDLEDVLRSAAKSDLEERRPAVSHGSPLADSVVEKRSATSPVLQEDAPSADAGSETPKFHTKSASPRVLVKRLTSTEVSCASRRKGKRVKEAAGFGVDDIAGSSDTDSAEETTLLLSSPQVLNAADNEDEDEKIDNGSDEENETSYAVDKAAQHVTAEDSSQTLMSGKATELPKARSTNLQNFFGPNKEGLFVADAMKYKNILKNAVIRLSRDDPAIIEHLKKIGQNNACRHSTKETSVDSDGRTANQDEEVNDDDVDYAFVLPDVCNDDFYSVDDDEAGAVMEDTRQTSAREDDGTDIDATAGSNGDGMQTPPSPPPPTSPPPPPSPHPSSSPPSPKNLKTSDAKSADPEATPAEAAENPETSKETTCEKTASSDKENVVEGSTEVPSDHPAASAKEEEEEEDDGEIFPEMFCSDVPGRRPCRNLARRRPFYDSDDSLPEVTWSRADEGRPATAGASTANPPSAASAPGSRIVREKTSASLNQEAAEKWVTDVHASGLSSQFIKPGSNFTSVHSSSSNNGSSAGSRHLEQDRRTLQSGVKESNKNSEPRHDQSTPQNNSSGSVRAERFPGSAKSSTSAVNEDEQPGNKNAIVMTHSFKRETTSSLALKRKEEGTFQAASKRFKNAAIEPSVSSLRNPGQPQVNGLLASKNGSVVCPPRNLHLSLSDIRVQLTRKDKVSTSFLLPQSSGQGAKEQSRLTPTGTVTKRPEESTNSTAKAAPEKTNPRNVTFRSKEIQTTLSASPLRSRSGCREPEMNGDVPSSPTRRASSGEKRDETSRTPRSSSAEGLSRSPLSPARPAGMNGEAAGASRKRKATSPDGSPCGTEKRPRGHVTRSSSRESDASRSPSTGRRPLVTKSWFMRSRSPASPAGSPDRAQGRPPRNGGDRDASPTTAAKPRTVTIGLQKNDDSGKVKRRIIVATGGSAENHQAALKSGTASDGKAGQTLSSPQTVHVAATRTDAAKLKTPYIPLVSIDSQPRNGAATRLEDRNIFSMFGDSSALQ